MQLVLVLHTFFILERILNVELVLRKKRKIERICTHVRRLEFGADLLPPMMMDGAGGLGFDPGRARVRLVPGEQPDRDRREEQADAAPQMPRFPLRAHRSYFTEDGAFDFVRPGARGEGRGLSMLRTTAPIACDVFDVEGDGSSASSSRGQTAQRPPASHLSRTDGVLALLFCSCPDSAKARPAHIMHSDDSLLYITSPLFFQIRWAGYRPRARQSQQGCISCWIFHVWLLVFCLCNIVVSYHLPLLCLCLCICIKAARAQS